MPTSLSVAHVLNRPKGPTPLTQPANGVLGGPARPLPSTPQYWYEKGIIWPLDLSFPVGATDYNSLAAWVRLCVLNIDLLPDSSYDGKAVGPKDLPIAAGFIAGVSSSVPPYAAWSTPQALAVWRPSLIALASLVYGPTAGPVIPVASLSNLSVNSPQGTQKIVVKYVGIAYDIPPGNVLLHY